MTPSSLRPGTGRFRSHSGSNPAAELCNERAQHAIVSVSPRELLAVVRGVR